MGCYDTLQDGEQYVQVKTWDRDMQTFAVGDEVPPIQNCYNYSIKFPDYISKHTAGTKFALILEGRFRGFTKKCVQLPVFNKYGGRITGGEV